MNIFGFPLYHGMTQRQAKKLCRPNRWRKLQQFNGFKVDDLIRTCQGLNEFVLSAEPIYLPTKRGAVLVDIDLSTTYSSCSLNYCCGLPITYQEAVRYREDAIKGWSENDVWGFVDRYTNMIINPDGTFTPVEKNAQTK